ncbi:MAG: hypothetical protein ACOYT4_03665 [Nanoarchaeota archaeon]
MRLTNPIVDGFTMMVLQTLYSQKYHYEKKQIINADLIPRVPEKIIKEKILTSRETKPITEEDLKKSAKNLELYELTKPLDFPKSFQKPIVKNQLMQPNKIKASEKLTIAVPENFQVPESEYSKIDLLLKDPSVTLIECNGEGQALKIIRSGQKQLTKIVLKEEDIKKILDKISEKTRIPIIEGLFRAATDNFVINAVISKSIGSRFIIKKQTPYSLIG